MCLLLGQSVERLKYSAKSDGQNTADVEKVNWHNLSCGILLSLICINSRLFLKFDRRIWVYESFVEWIYFTHFLKDVEMPKHFPIRLNIACF